ncbi:transcriptional regulator, partial [Streptomyces sp. NPDC005989]
MLRFEVSVEDLLRSRFALSPAMELCALLRSLAGQDRPLPRAWAARLLPAFERLRRETELNAALAARPPALPSSPRPLVGGLGPA